MAVDPSSSSIVMGDPQSWNRYNYVLNNPLKLVDPDGMVWKVKGNDSAKASLEQTANSSMHGKDLKVVDGKATLVDNGQQGPPSPAQAAFESTVTQVINDAKTVTTKITEGSKSVLIGDSVGKTIDISDVQAFGSANPASAGAILGHELAEDFALQNLTSNIGTAHAQGNKFEAGISGYTKISDPEGLSAGRYGRFTGQFTIGYQRSDGKVDVTVTASQGNVTNVERTPK